MPPASATSLRLSRRALLAGAGALMLPLRASAQDVAAAAAESTAGSLASSIGSKLASGVAGAVAGVALGQILKLAGLDTTGQAAVMAKLDAILQRLDALEFRVKDMRASMDKQLTQLRYDTTEQVIAPLIDLNAGLRRHFASLAHTQPANLEAAKEQIRHLFGTVRLDLAPETWHNALTGGAGQTSLIEAWASAVFSRHADWFDPDAATKIQKQWDFFDAQQALSINYLIEHYNDAGTPELAQDTLATWHENRARQVALLRGMVKDSMAWRAVDASGAVIEGSFALNHLPDNVAVVPETRIMWCLVGSLPVRMAESPEAFQREVDAYAATAAALTGVGGEDQLPANRWRLYDWQSLMKLMKDSGGQVGGSGSDKDHFVAAMSKRGFAMFNPGVARLWTTECTDPIPPLYPTYGRTAFVDGDSWWRYHRDPETTAELLLGRDLAPGEETRYWYPPA